MTMESILSQAIIMIPLSMILITIIKAGHKLIVFHELLPLNMIFVVVLDLLSVNNLLGLVSCLMVGLDELLKICSIKIILGWTTV